MSSRTTSFQKKLHSKLTQIPGTRPSLYNNQLLISTGIPSLDNVIGGGIAVGTVLMIEEDCYGNYSRLLLKYYCAESVMSYHSLLLSSLDTDPKQMASDLPAPILDGPGVNAHAVDGKVQSDMKIAWRYQNLPQNQPDHKVKFGHYYDVRKNMDSDLVGAAAKTILSEKELVSNSDKSGHGHKYIDLLNAIKSEINIGCFSTASVVEKRNILRICIHSLGSPQWNENDDDTSSLPRFLLGLRALVRSAFAVCVLTVPTHLFHDTMAISQIERLCDTVIHLESFDGSEKNPLFSDYRGLLNIVQLPRLNSLTCHMPDTLDLAFKLRRGKFIIEKLHLPPELSENVNHSPEDQQFGVKLGLSCGEPGRTVLGF